MSDVTDGIIAMPFELAMGTEVARRQFHGCAVAEINRLKAELECARGDLKTAMDIVERNQKDADRYQFLRRDVSHRVSDFCIVKKFWGGTMPDRILEGDDADLEIDGELAKERT